MLIWYGSKVPRERIMWIEIYACSFFFAMIQRFSSSVALSPTQLRLFYWMEDPIFFIR